MYLGFNKIQNIVLIGGSRLIAELSIELRNKRDQLRAEN